jgi:transposase
MEHYVGLDVSLKQISICVVNQVGSVVREGVVDSEPEAIAAFVRSKAPGAIRIGLETGPTATWLWTELKQLGLPVICIDARHAKAVLKMQVNKSDRNDAAGIARIMQTGWFKEVRVKDLDSHSLRALLILLGGVAAAKSLSHASAFTRVAQPDSKSDKVAKLAIVGVWLLLSGS